MQRGFDEALQFGGVIEQYVAQRLHDDGWRVIALANLPSSNGHGPRVLGMEHSPPDLQATKHGKSVAVEVKAKTHPTWGRLSQEWEHGIDQCCWDAYNEYNRLMLPTFLIVIEVGEQGTDRDAYIARITSLGVRESEINGTPVVMFPRSHMRRDCLATLNRHINQSGWKHARESRQNEGIS